MKKLEKNYNNKKEDIFNETLLFHCSNYFYCIQKVLNAVKLCHDNNFSLDGCINEKLLKIKVFSFISNKPFFLVSFLLSEKKL